MLPPTTCLSDTLVMMNNIMVDISSFWQQNLYLEASSLAKTEGNSILEIILQFGEGSFMDEEIQHINNFKIMMMVLTNDVIDFYDY